MGVPSLWASLAFIFAGMQCKFRAGLPCLMPRSWGHQRIFECWGELPTGLLYKEEKGATEAPKRASGWPVSSAFLYCVELGIPAWQDTLRKGSSHSSRAKLGHIRVLLLDTGS